MMESVKEGAGREDAHAAIKEHALATVKDLRNGKIKENNLTTRLSKDKRIGLPMKKIKSLMVAGEKSIGASNQQVESFAKKAKSWRLRFPETKTYSPPSNL